MTQYPTKKGYRVYQADPSIIPTQYYVIKAQLDVPSNALYEIPYLKKKFLQILPMADKQEIDGQTRHDFTWGHT